MDRFIGVHPIYLFKKIKDLKSSMDRFIEQSYSLSADVKLI